MARGRRGRPQTVTTLPPWPLDKPKQPPASAAVEQRTPAPAVGGLVDRTGDDYWCRACHRAVTTEGLPPAGWLRLQQRSHDAARAWYTQGLYCSPACLAGDVGASR